MSLSEPKNNEVPDTQKLQYVEKDNVITTRCIKRHLFIASVLRGFFVRYKTMDQCSLE